MKIRKYQSKDKQRVIEICLKNADIDASTSEDTVKFIEYTFCRYYIEVEPENCFVAVDENDVPYGYVYGAGDFDNYRQKFEPYLETVAGLKNGAFTADVYVEMYNHYIYKDEYPAHLHIDVLDGHRGEGTGAKLIENYCENLRSRGIKGVMLIVGSDNDGGRNFYEKNGFTLLNDRPFGAAYGKKL